VPPTFIVDDFFITLKVLDQNKYALFNPEAICQEDVDSDTLGEYRRKVRISSGNFQNLFYFKWKLLQFWTALSFTFWSHKVLRWFTPSLLLLALISSGLLIPLHPVFAGLFALQLLGMLWPLLDYVFNFKNQLFKFISHFYLMNFALMEGFIKFITGIKTNIWQPVKRNV
jgi:cellulose synthase/poly-beta-1,6-N-acetylglucosamine synthase-like glycosyltransferase